MFKIPFICLGIVKNYLIILLVSSILFFGGMSNSFAEIESVNVVENKLVTLIGEGHDSDIENLDFLWTQTFGESVILSSNSIREPTFMAPEVQNGKIKVLTFEFTVTDPLGASSSDIVELIVNPVNHIPTVNAGRDLVAFSTIHAMTIFPTVFDADDDDLTYKWENLSGQSIPMQSSESKYLTVLPMTLDYSNFEPATFQITVDDGFGGTASDIVNVYPYPNSFNNKRISVQAGPIQTVIEGDSVRLSATGNTLDGKPITYSWTQLLGTSVTLSSFYGDHTEFIAPDVGDHTKLLSFQVTGYSQGNGWASAIGLVKVLPSNNPPVADAGNDQNVLENILVKLEGTGTDPDSDDTLKYSWTQKSGVDVKLYERASFSVYFFSPNIQSDNTQLVFELTVTDNHGISDTDTVNININSINSPPRAFAGPDKSVTGGTQVTIVGQGIDPDGDPLTFEWMQLSGNAMSFDKTNPTITFTVPDVSPTVSTRVALQLTVTDPYGQSNSDQVIIFVYPENGSPIANVGPDMSIDENTVVNLVCIGSDPDGDLLDYSWTSSSDIELMQSNTSTIFFKTPSVVFDTTVSMTCTVSDGVFSSSDSMNITIKNTLSLDIVADAGVDRIVNEGVQINLDASKSFDAENQKLSYQWTQVSGETVVLSSTTDILPFFTTPVVNNNEIKVLIFELRVYDNNNREDIDSVTITVDPINSIPEASASARQ